MFLNISSTCEITLSRQFLFLLFFFFFGMCVCLGGIMKILHTRNYVSKHFLSPFCLHSMSMSSWCHGKHFQFDIIIIVNILVISSCVSASITPFSFGQDIFNTVTSAILYSSSVLVTDVHYASTSRKERCAPIKLCQWDIFSGFYLYNMCVALLWVIFVCPTY